VRLLDITFQGLPNLIRRPREARWAIVTDTSPASLAGVATIQPDPEVAAAFYGELFGWDYEDGGGFLVARLRGRDVAAVAPLPPGVDPPPPPDWITDIRVESADGKHKAPAAPCWRNPSRDPPAA
jgi:hypothetical protein